MDNSPWIRRCPFSSCMVWLSALVRICLPFGLRQVTVGCGEPQAVQGRVTFSPMLAVTSTGASENNGPTVEGGVSFCLRKFSVKYRVCVHTQKCILTSNLQTDSTSGSPRWAAGHTAVLTRVALLHPSNVQSPTVYILLHIRSRANLKLIWEYIKRAHKSQDISFFSFILCKLSLVSAYLWTNGQGEGGPLWLDTPEWHYHQWTQAWPAGSLLFLDPLKKINKNILEMYLKEKMRAYCYEEFKTIQRYFFMIMSQVTFRNTVSILHSLHEKPAAAVHFVLLLKPKSSLKDSMVNHSSVFISLV